MKILHISPYALRGGCEKNCFHFISASLEMSHQVLVLGEEGPMSQDWKGLEIRVEHLNILNSNLWLFTQILKEIVQSESYDWIIYWSTVRISQVLSAIQFSTLHVRIYLGNPSGYNTFQLWKEKIWSFCKGKPKDVKLMACSKFVSNSFKHQIYFKGFPMEVSYNPIEIPESNPYKNQFNSEDIQVGMVARLDPIKNHTLLIQAFYEVNKKYPSMVLNLVGDGSLMKFLNELVIELKITEKVKFWGDQKDVYAFLRQWDLFIYSTTLQEGLGSVVIEAMANGTWME